MILSVSFFIGGLPDPVAGIQEDRKKVPWSDKETIILLEIWGDQQVKGDAHMHRLLIFNFDVYDTVNSLCPKHDFQTLRDLISSK